MSRCAGVHVQFWDVPATEALFRVLIEAGWEHDYYGAVNYVEGSGEGEGCKWAIVPLTEWPNVEERLYRGELSGLGMCWRGTKLGGLFRIARDRRELRVHLSGHRRSLRGCAPFTDASWYLSRILSPLLGARFDVRGFDCIDDQ